MRSELRLVCDYRYFKTQMEDLYFTPPYKIMHPFWDGEKMEVILMSGSAGLLAGDDFHSDITLKENAYLTFSSQSYEKIFDTMDDKAQREVHIKLGDNATLKYLPLPMIPYAGSSFVSDSEIYLEKTSKLAFSDICSCGRVGMGEKFRLKAFISKTKIFVAGELAFADHTYLVPEELQYDTLGMWGNYTHCGMMYIYTGTQDNYMDELSIKIRKICENPAILAGVSACHKGLLVRSLGYSGDELYKLHLTISALIE